MPRVCIQSWARGLGMLFLGTFGAAGFGFLAQVVLARVLPVPEYGRLASLMAAVNLLTPVAGYGLPWFLLQVFGEEGAAGFRWMAPCIKVLALMAAASLMALLAYGWLSAWSGMVVLLVPVLLGQCLAEMRSAALQLEGRYAGLAVWQAVTQIGRFLVVGLVCLALLPERRSVGHALCGYALVGFGVSLVSVHAIARLYSRRIVLSGHAPRAALAAIPGIGEVWARALPGCLMTVFYLLYFQTVLVPLGWWEGQAATAQYNAALQIVAAAFLVPNIVYAKYLAPRIFRWAEHDRPLLLAATHIGVLAMAVAGVVVMLVLMVAAPRLVALLFGPGYAAAVPILRVLALAVPIRFVQSTYGSTFFSRAHMARKVRYMGQAALICMLLNLVLIPAWGASGAALSAVVAEAALLALYQRGATRFVEGMKTAVSFRFTAISASLARIGVLAGRNS